MKRFLLVAVLILVVVGGLVWWRGSQTAAHDKQVKDEKAADAIPVVTVPVAVGDVPVYLDGIGTVQALYTVNVHSHGRWATGGREIPRGPGREGRGCAGKDRSAHLSGDL